MAAMVPDPAFGDFAFNRFHIDLSTRTVVAERVTCADLEDVLGGVARGFKLLMDRRVADAYDDRASLVMNLGILSGTAFMTGLRTFFMAYSPLKCSRAGMPAVMWSAGSGKFGTKLRHLGVDEVVFTGRAIKPVCLRITQGPEFKFEDAHHLRGKTVNEKIQTLHALWPDAHFAVLGPAGENHRSVRYAAIALSTENQLKSGDPKARFCGRGGMGGVMGSKNLLAIAADTTDRKGAKTSPALKRLNLEVARGKGSSRFRDKKRHNGGGGTWANYEALGPVHAVPEMNFKPTGTEVSVPLYRPNVEKAGWTVKDEACYRCGIRCHKNIYDESGFRAKFDYEPLNLLSGNLGIFDIDRICTLVARVDELGMDTISLGTTLAYVMEYNARHPESPVAGGLSFGDADGVAKAIDAIGTGTADLLGQGSKRISEQLGEPGYAMHCKGVEFPAYLPQTNPGYPFALAGGHMSMQTYLLLLYEKETSEDYWVEAITKRGPSIMRDDLLGVCKFAGLGSKDMVEAVREIGGLEIDAKALRRAITRTYLRGYRIEKNQGFDEADYDMPADAHEKYPEIDLPHFNTQTFFGRMKKRVLARFDEMLEEEGL
jgi:aldehyde:ferredoxin oxidoreductase